ncbi:MAG: phosphate ABC transporter permease PstA [Spirochaetes bacterium]|nr:phosphate ABC transporter permease PstA [Spirochaetota bacterium]
MSVETVKTEEILEPTLPSQAPRGLKRYVPLSSYGTPYLWLMGGMLGISLTMIVGLLLLILVMGSLTFWPQKIIQFETVDGKRYLGEVTRRETYKPSREQVGELPELYREKANQFLESRQGISERFLVRTGNYERTNTHFHWVSDFQIQNSTYPEWAFVWERLSWGRFYGIPVGFQVDGKLFTEGLQESYRLFRQHFPDVQKKRNKIYYLEKEVLGALNYKMEQARLNVREKELKLRNATGERREALQQELQKANAEYSRLKENLEFEYGKIRAQIETLKKETQRYSILMQVSDGSIVPLPLATIVRGYPANQLSWFEKVLVYLDRWKEFLLEEPREANSEGGVFPAIFGTVVMTLLMSLVVSPLGVIAALYLREYARAGFLVSAVRIALNNLAGVPSIVFGVFGLGFFCYFVGTSIDQLFFQARLPNPTFGTGGILWSALTLALLTLPVVIVASEEALAAVPNSMREGAYACGASKWQTIQRIVIPRALPGILTGMILAMARGAGEVAPLMLVGAVKLAPELPIDGNFPFIHLERSFMHLGFHIYDVGFQSQNSEAAKPMVFTTTLLLILIIVVLNLVAIFLRNRLYRKFISREV